MSNFRILFIGMLSVGLFSLLIGLAGCASDGGYSEDYDGHHKLWKERAFSRHTGNGFTSDEILSGGINQ